jgi:serine/threonine protein kinase/tetratricopeptide (TPR) repeat protein
MDAPDWARASALLDELLELDAGARATRLRELARADAALAARLERLLALEADRADFLRDPLPLDQLGEPEEAALRAGERIGPYHLLRLLGEGGMGTVWLAERADGLYQRQVALKLLRAAGAAHALRARFARERQILAQLSHPNIARLFDAGVDQQGRPYLALEYVEGIALVEHAQRRGLDVEARLRLFEQVCDAVAYAHGRLVVHRDLKPSNILVAADGRVRLLDFGIAKLLDPESTGGETELTRLGGRAYTLHYAAPEQIRGEAIGTQTDVYALGVVLYELLTGHRPYRLRRGTPAEIEEAILQAEPRRPSQVVARRSEEAITESTGGHDTRGARQLARQLAGDLDNILLKALRKKPEERYASVEAFAKDLRLHREGRPVSARPDRFGYRAAKFARRNALGLTLGAAALALLLGGSAMLYWQGRRALEEAQRAQAIQDFMLGLFQRTDPNLAQRGDLTVADLLRDGARRAREELALQPAVQRELLLTIAGLQSGFGRYEDALDLLDATPTGDSELGQLRLATERGRAHRGQERIAACLDALRAVEPIAARLRRDAPLAVAHYLAMRGRCHRMAGDPAAARIAFDDALRLREAHRASPLLVSEVLTDLAALDADAGNYTAAIEQMQRALQRLEREGGARNIMGINLWRSLGALQRERGDPVAAESGFRRAIELGDALYPDGHPSAVEARRQLAATLVDYGRLDEAEPLLRDVLAFQRRVLGERHSDVGSTLNSQAILAWKRGDNARAIALLHEAVAIWREGEHRGRLAGGLHNLGMVLRDDGRLGEAEAQLREALRLREAVFGPDHVPVAMTLRLLGEIATHDARHAEAQALLERALRIEIARHGERHPQTALVHLSLARLDYARGELGGGDARIAKLLAETPPDDAERQRVRAQARLIQAEAHCRHGDARGGRAHLLAAEAERVAPDAIRAARREADAACDTP